MKKILILSDYYPPIGSVASFRSAYISIAFQNRGWDVHVVCRRVNENHFIDNSIAGLPPKSNIHRVNITDNHSDSIITKIINQAHKIFIPEFYRGRKNLYFQYFKESSEILKKYRIKWIYTSSGPETMLLIGYNLKKKFKLNWIADLRDIPEMYRFRKVIDKIYKQSLIYSQNKRLKFADIVVTVSEPFALLLKKRINKKVHIVLNGFDQNLHSNIIKKRNTDKFKIIYTGSIHSSEYQDPEPIFKIIDDLIISGDIKAENVRIEFYGSNAEQIVSASKKYLCFDLIKVFKRSSLLDTIGYQHQANVLLLLTVLGQKGIYTTKLFDYIASGRPIIAYPDDNDVVNDLIRRYQAGICSSNTDEIKKALLKWYVSWIEGEHTVIERNQDEMILLTRKYQSDKLVDIVESVNNKQ